MLAFTSPAALARSLARSSDGLVSCVSGHLQLAPITPSTRRACLSRPFSSLASSSTSSPSALAAFRVRAPYHSFQSNRSPTLLAAARSFSASSPSPVIRDSYFRDDSQRSNRRNAGRPPSSGGAWEKLKAAFWAGVMRFERLPFKTVMALIIAPNVLVFLGWQAINFYKSRSLYQIMRQNFELSEFNVRAGRWWTIFTSSISHMEVFHLGVNMFCLWSIAGGVIPVVGNTRFMALYLLSAVGGGLASLASRKLVDGKGPSVGASGAIAGLLAFFAAAFPTQRVLVFFVIPVQMRYGVTAAALYDLFAEVYYGANRYVDGSGHLGGGAVGLLFFAWMRRRWGW